jgi:uncharacterized protein YkwD
MGWKSAIPAQLAADPAALAEQPVEGVVGKPRMFTRMQLLRQKSAVAGQRPRFCIGKAICIGMRAGTATVAAPAQYAAVLGAHNEYRSTHGVPAMTWDDAAAAAAANWASKCLWQSEAKSPYGENLFMSPGKDAAAAMSAATEAW